MTMLGTSAPDVACESPEEATLRASFVAATAVGESQECCLVQIYPADVVTGMLLLEDEVLSVGRESHHGLCLPDSSVSRKHAEFVRSSSGYQVRDLGSTNGTLVNGCRTSECELQSGDIVQLGCYMFKFLAAGSVESQYHETVYTSMTRDALTGAVNKRYLLESLEREIARSKRQQSPLAVVMLDIDHFKSVNDTHGHLVGDEVLHEFGARILSICRADDLFARYGGEEFCLVTFGSDRQEVLDIAERCRAIVNATPFMTAVGELEISASFGVAVLEVASNEDVLELLKRSDDRLYEAKNSGRNRICI